MGQFVAAYGWRICLMAFRCHQRSQLLALGAAVPMDLQLGVNLIHILLDGSFREVELLRNFPVTHPFGCHARDFSLFFCQRCEKRRVLSGA